MAKHCMVKHIGLYSYFVIKSYCIFMSNQESTFTKCDDCMKYKKALESTTSKAQRADAQHHLNGHLDLVM